jgi:uncharacterized membrane protein YfcA
MGLWSIGLVNVILAVMVGRAAHGPKIPHGHVLNVADPGSEPADPGADKAGPGSPTGDQIVVGGLPNEGIGDGSLASRGREPPPATEDAVAGEPPPATEDAVSSDKEAKGKSEVPVAKSEVPTIIVEDLTDHSHGSWGTPVYPDELPTWSKFNEAVGRMSHECDPREPQKACGVELVCRKGLCAPCMKDSECPDKHRCDIEVDGRNICVERKLLDAYNSNDAWLTFWVFVCTILSAASGVGGGGMFVPLFLMFLDMTPSDAVPLSQSLIFFSSVVNMAFFIFQRHPLCESRAKIDYDTVMLLEPGLACGVIIGVLLNRISPRWVITVSLVATLGLSFMRTSSKALTIWKKETQEKPPTNQDDSTPEVSAVQSQAPTNAMFDTSALSLLSKYRIQLGIIVIVWLCAFLSNFHRVKSCSWQYMIYLLGFFTAMAGITFASGMFLRTTSDPENGRTEEEVKHGITWTKSTTTVYPLVAFAAGLLGGMLGLGGGMIIAPFLVELGLHPEVIQASTAFFVFLSSSLAATQFALKNQVLPEYVFYYSTVAVVATLLGQTVVLKAIRQSGRNSIIVMCIAGVLIVSLVMMTYLGIMGTIADYNSGVYMGMDFYKLCIA